MQKGDRLTYTDIAGREYNYIVTEVSEDSVTVAWEEDTKVNTVFDMERAKRIADKLKKSTK